MKRVEQRAELQYSRPDERRRPDLRVASVSDHNRSMCCQGATHKEVLRQASICDARQLRGQDKKYFAAESDKVGAYGVSAIVLSHSASRDANVPSGEIDVVVFGRRNVGLDRISRYIANHHHHGDEAMLLDVERARVERPFGTA